MEQTYRLEFNFNQQGFHLDRGSHEENTHGWMKRKPSRKLQASLKPSKKKPKEK